MLKVVTTFSGPAGTPWSNVLYFTGDDTQTGANNAVSAVGTFWGACDNNMGNTVTWATDPDVALLNTSGTRTGGFTTTPATGTGAIASPTYLPFQDQAQIRLFTGSFVGGRQVRGSINVPGVTTSSLLTTGLPGTTLRSNLQTAINALIATSSPRFVVWSRKNAVAIPVATADTLAVWATRRSRRD